MIIPDREVVLASAGSGKTYRLSGSYLRLIAHGASIESVLATTFTRKAAGEIARRVLRRCVDAAMDEGAAARLDSQTGVSLGRAGWGDAAVRLARGVDRMRVLTLDAFFVALAQGSAGVMGATPGWGLVAEHEETALRMQGVDAVLERVREADEREELLELFRMLHGGDPKTGVRSALDSVSSDGAGAYWNAHGAAEPWHALDGPASDLDESAIGEAIERTRTAPLPVSKSTGKPNGHWVKAHARLLELLDEREWESVAGHGLGATVCDEGGTYYNIEAPAELVDALSPLVLHARADVGRTHHARTRAVYDLVHRTERALVALKRASGKFTFSDVPRALGSLDEPTFLRLLDRLDERVQHLLLDEYQDTSVEQHRLVRPLLEEIASDPQRARGAVCVGDVKQALYLWREATPEILGSLQGEFPSLDATRLDTNWRSSPVVLDAVNGVFEGLVDNAVFNDDTLGGAQSFARYWEPQVAQHRELPGRVVLESVVRDESDKNQRRYERAADIAKQITEEYPGATVGVLTRAKKGVIPRVLWAMQSAGVEASEEGGNPLTDSPAVSAALSALRLAHHPGHTMALYHAGTSALAGVLGIEDPLDRDAGRAVASRVRRALADDGPAAVFGRWWRAARRHMTARDDVRFGQLVDLAGRLEREEGALDARTIVERVETEQVEAPTRASVRVMTIHASKGLEFDAVILADLDRNWSIQRDPVLVQREHPLEDPSVITRYPNETARASDPRLAAVYTGAMGRHVLGELCALYVAMTRARRSLHMVIDHPSEKKLKSGAYTSSLASVVRASLSPQTEEEGVLYEHGDAECLDGVGIGDAPTETVREATLELVPGGLAGSAGLARRAPSSVGRAQAGVSVRSLLNTDYAAADAGTLVHDLFETVAWTDRVDPCFDPEGGVRLLVARHGCEEREAQDACHRVEQALDQKGVREALSEGRYLGDVFGPSDRVELWRERSFAARITQDGEDVLLRGRFDRVVIGYAGDHVSWCEVLDYKTEASTDAEIAEVAEGYRPQLDAYRAALVSMTGVHPDAVRTTLVFVDRGVAHTLE